MTCLSKSLRPSLDSRHTAEILVNEIGGVVVGLDLLCKLPNAALCVIHLLLIVVEHTTPEMLGWLSRSGRRRVILAQVAWSCCGQG